MSEEDKTVDVKKTASMRQVFEDFKTSSQAYSTLFKEIEKDFEFAQGKQWDNADVTTLEKAGVKALTINKIRPMIKLVSGIERQSRSDFLAFPEGGEDTLVAEIATRLLKHIVKQSKAEHKLSSQFKNGITGGVRYLEPFISYDHDILNGEMKFREVSGRKIYPDPAGEEYDLSDRRYVIKFTPGMSRDELIQLFPDDEKKLDNIMTRRLSAEVLEDVNKLIQGENYPELDSREAATMHGDSGNFDLIEYYYKKLVKKYFIADKQQGILQEAESLEKAQEFVSTQGDAFVIEKFVPEIRLKQVVGNVEMFDGVSWTYPRWKGYPIIPFFSEMVIEDIKDQDLLIQGLVRGLRDLQVEYNKRRTQELRHLNSTVNSGWFIPKGALGKKVMSALKKVGSSPGFTGEFDPAKTGGTAPSSWRINPGPLSQGHAQLAAENAQDIKEASGVNPDLLANDSQSQSGRAILLKQRQGLVMVQEALDNYGLTKQILGRFLLTQLGELFTIETSTRVVGEKFIQENFSRPVAMVLEKALIKQQNGEQLSDTEAEVLQTYGQAQSPADLANEDGSPITVVDNDEVGITFNQVLNDAGLGKYDVSIGEGPFNETFKMANFAMLMELAGSGIPIPPDVLIGESLLNEGSKEKIIASIQAAQQAQAAEVQEQSAQAE
jgi:hypothetical protein